MVQLDDTTRAPVPPAKTPPCPYDMTHADEAIERRTLACIVDNEPGSSPASSACSAAATTSKLTVAETDRNAHTSRITIVTSGTPHVLEARSSSSFLRLVRSRR